MALAVAIQMDPIDTINIDADSTFALALEGQARGHALFHYLPQALTLRDGRLFARGRKLEVFRRHGNHHRFGDFEELDLAGFDVVLMRQDPPFDMAYITATHLLELLQEEGPLVVNDPASVRNAPEKLFVLRFKELMPPTLLTLDVARNPRILARARRHHRQAAVRQWRRRRIPSAAGRREFERADRDVRRFPPRAGHGAALSARGAAGRQAHHPGRGRAGRRGQPGAARGRGARQSACRRPRREDALTERERDICPEIGPTLREQGLVFVGIDVIGDYITEINVTSPTGIQEIARLDGVDLAVNIWDAIEARHAARRHGRPS